MNHDAEVLLDAIEACRLMQSFTSGFSYEEFQDDKKTQSSVLYQIAILGESVNQFSSEFLEANPNIPFHAIRGMRNRVIHEYKEVDISILWEVIRRDIPELLQLLSQANQNLKK